MGSEIATGQFKTDFINWAKKREPFNFNKHTKQLICFGKYFFDLPLAFQFNAFEVFADDNEFCIHVEPYLGGGQPAYCSSIMYRNERHIDTEIEVTNKGNAEFWTRFEATEEAIIALNELYNKQVKLLKGDSNV